MKFLPRRDLPKCRGFNCPERNRCARFVRPAARENQLWAELWKYRVGGTCDNLVAIPGSAPNNYLLPGV